MNQPVWRGRARSGLMTTLMLAIFGCVIMLALVASYFAPVGEQLQSGDWWWIGGVTGFGVLSAFIVFDLNLEVRPDHAVISWGPFGFPRRRIHWSHVVSVRSIQVRPMEWGGWGYRWVPWRRATAAVLRKGPGLRFDFQGGKIFVMTLPQAAEALTAIESVLPPQPDLSCGHDHH